MKNNYCECGYLVLGDTCSHCARRAKSAVAENAKTSAAPALNRTLVELRDLKSRLQNGFITEVEYDERRNNILATF